MHHKKTCSKCGKSHDGIKGRDRYCKPCRRAYNRARQTETVRKLRGDRYYWDTVVPKIRARDGQVWSGRPGIFHPVDPGTVDQAGYDGALWTRTFDPDENA
jgi:hypothetical protein